MNAKAQRYLAGLARERHRLARQAPRLIHGAIDGGSSATQLFNERKEWEFRLVLDAWRAPGEPVAAGPLVVRQVMSRVQFERWTKRVGTPGIVKLRVRGPLVLRENEQHALLVHFLGTVRDRPLARRVQELTRHSRLAVPGLGVFLRRGHNENYERKVRWLGRRVTLSLDTWKCERPSERTLDHARELLACEGRWKLKVEQALAGPVYRLWRKRWRTPEDDRLTCEQFVRLMRAKSVIVDREGLAVLRLSARQLFGGYEVVLSASARCDRLRVEIA